MKSHQYRTNEAYLAMLAHDRVTTAPPGSEIHTFAQRLRKKLADIEGFQVQQFRNRHASHLAPLRARIDAVRYDLMLPMARLTRGLFEGEPRMQRALAVPHKRAPSDQIMAAGLAMVRALKPHLKLLKKEHIDVSRLEQIAQELRAVKKLMPAANAKIADRAAPTLRIAVLFRSASRDANALRLIVQQQLRRDKEATIGWEKAHRIGKRLGRPRKKPVPAITVTDVTS